MGEGEGMCTSKTRLIAAVVAGASALLERKYEASFIVPLIGRISQTSPLLRLSRVSPRESKYRTGLPLDSLSILRSRLHSTSRSLSSFCAAASAPASIVRIPCHRMLCHSETLSLQKNLMHF